jgi:hypothetical protein
MFQTKVVTRKFILFVNICGVYEIMWKNMVGPGRPQTTIWRMRTASWLTKATDTHSEYVRVFHFPRQRWLRECASTLPYIGTLPVLLLSELVTWWAVELIANVVFLPWVMDF